MITSESTVLWRGTLVSHGNPKMTQKAHRRIMYALSPPCNTHTYTHIHARTHAHTATHSLTHTYHTHTHAHARTHSHSHTPRTHTHTHTHTRTHAHTHAHKHTHTLTHTHRIHTHLTAKSTNEKWFPSLNFRIQDGASESRGQRLLTNTRRTFFFHLTAAPRASKRKTQSCQQHFIWYLEMERLANY